MEINSLFDISASGMQVERLRMKLIALNLANANTTSAGKSGLYKPLKLSVQPLFKQTMQSMENMNGVFNPDQDLPAGVSVAEVYKSEVESKVVYDPNHPDADSKGYVTYPGVNPVTEMVDMMRVTRSYEANIKAFNATRSMAMKALEIGR